MYKGPQWPGILWKSDSIEQDLLVNWKFFDLVACQGSDKEALGSGAGVNATWEILNLDSIHIFIKFPKNAFLEHNQICLIIDGCWYMSLYVKFKSFINS